MAVFSYFVPHWIYISYFAFSIALTYVPALKFIPESPSWLLTQGKDADAQRYLESVARINKREIPSDLHEKMKVN